MTIFDFLTACVVVPVICYSLYRLWKLGIEHEKQIVNKRLEHLAHLQDGIDLINCRLDYFFNQNQHSDE